MGALAKTWGSPPGLSRAEMRHARDACKAPLSWGSHGVTPDAGLDASAVALDLGSAAKQRAPREILDRVKTEAALLKGRSHQDAKRSTEASPCVTENTKPSDLSANGCCIASIETDSLSDLQMTKSHQCRFGVTALGTIPSTPVRGNASLASPPGLSRKSLRQARDACKGGLRTTASWGSLRTGALLTIGSSGKPTPR